MSAEVVCSVDGLTYAEHEAGIDEDSPGHGPWYLKEQWDQWNPGDATTLWKCPECGDVMPAGYSEDDHFTCNRPEDFPATTGSEQ